jgi:hypothetical protein
MNQDVLEFINKSDEDRDSYLILYQVYANSEEEAKSKLDNPDGTYCQHSYDCCGHWYCGAAKFIGAVNNFYYFRQGWHQNI